jgi:hypothetical protein
MTSCPGARPCRLRPRRAGVAGNDLGVELHVMENGAAWMSEGHVHPSATAPRRLPRRGRAGFLTLLGDPRSCRAHAGAGLHLAARRWARRTPLSVDAPVTVANCTQTAEAPPSHADGAGAAEMVPLSFTYPDLRCGGRYSGVAKCLRRPETRRQLRQAEPRHHAQPRAGGHRHGRPFQSCSWRHSQRFAQDVELRSFDGTVELEGNLIAYDGAYYQIDTIYGPLTVSAEGVSCAGPGCPDLTSFVAEAYIAGRRHRRRGPLPDLLSAFGAQQDLDHRARTANDHLHARPARRATRCPVPRPPRAPRMRGFSRS